jgi:EmrB/QacA subfamily drug resistance transporter
MSSSNDNPTTVEHPVEAPIDPAVLARRWLILSVLCLSLVLVVASVSSLNVALPVLGEQLGATDTQLIWIVDAYAVVFAGLLLPAGALGDRYGRKGALQLGLVIFATASTACAFTDAPNALIACRALMGVGAALIMPSTLSLLANVFPPQERRRAIAIWAGFAGAGGAIGPVMGGILLSHYYWGSVFFVAVPIALLALVLIAVLAPRSRDANEGRLDVVGSLLSIVGFSALLFAIIEGPELGWTDATTIGAFLIAALGLGGFLVRQRRTDHPLLDLVYFKAPSFSMGSFGVTFVFLSMFSLFFLLTQYLQFVHGYTPLEAGVRGLPFAATMIIVAPRSARLGARIGTKPMVMCGMTCVVAGLVFLSTSGVSTPYWRVAIGLVITALGPSLCTPSFTAGILSSVPLKKSGVGSAVNDVTREVGGAIGIALIGTVASMAYSNRLGDELSGLPDDVVARSQDSAGKALRVAGELTANGDVEGARAIHEAVQVAFAGAFQIGLRVSAVIALGALVVLAMRFPAGSGAAPRPDGSGG